MVRRICICSNCSRKFIAQSVELDITNIVCSSCQRHVSDNSTANPHYPQSLSEPRSQQEGDVLSETAADDCFVTATHDIDKEFPPSKRLKTKDSEWNNLRCKEDDSNNSINGNTGNDVCVALSDNEGERNLSPSTKPDGTTSAIPIIELLDDSEDEEGSEAMDEFYCTDVMDDDDHNDDDATNNRELQPAADCDILFDDSKPSTSDNQQGLPSCTDPNDVLKTATNVDLDAIDATFDTARQSSSTTRRSDQICFICGVSLANLKTGLKGRINHIKRCSKKNGVTGREVKLNDDHEDFVDTVPINANGTTVTTTSSTAPIVNSVNPYKKHPNSSSWHGGTVTEQQLADEFNHGPPADVVKDNNRNNKAQQQHQQPSQQLQQATIHSFFQRSTRSVNAVLMAGARRLAASAKMAATAAKAAPTNSKTVASTVSYSANQAAKKPWKQKRQWTVNESRSCPTYKKITGTDFVCDGFLYAKSSLTKNYFLTHFHSDHYGGITKAWNTGVIYCSLPTATLVCDRLGVDKQYLHPLPLLTPTVIESNGKPVTVTLIDANHCPGAVMFLFEVGNRRILHVGDFRWNREVMMKFAPMRELCTTPRRLDELYLDTTYCDEKYSLPTQEEAIRATIVVAEKEVANAKLGGKRILFLFGAYTIGKERIYLAVAERLKMKVYVDPQRFKILSALTWSKEQMSIFTTKKTESCLWVVPLGHINMKQMNSYLENNNFDKIIGFRPTGWSLTMRFNGIVNSRSTGNLTIHSVPYSEHSSFPELVDCVQCLNPKKIVPTVSVSKSQHQVDLILGALRQRQSTLCYGTATGS